MPKTHQEKNELPVLLGCHKSGDAIYTVGSNKLIRKPDQIGMDFSDLRPKPT